MLRPAQTRWLSLQMVVTRVLDQYEALLSYFVSEEADSILTKHLKDPLTKLYLQFLCENLPDFTKFNLLFQVSESGYQLLYYRFTSTACSSSRGKLFFPITSCSCLVSKAVSVTVLVY